MVSLYRISRITMEESNKYLSSTAVKEQGRTAYLRSIEVIQEVDRFADRYSEEEHPEE